MTPGGDTSIGRTRQALKCSGHRTDGEPCQAYAINGGKVCAVHGGRALQVKAAAARQLAERQAATILAGIGDYDPVTDPLTELQYRIRDELGSPRVCGDYAV